MLGGSQCHNNCLAESEANKKGLSSRISHYEQGSQRSLCKRQRNVIALSNEAARKSGDAQSHRKLLTE